MTNDRSVAQTLSRGLRIIEILAEKGYPMTAQELASEMELSRPIVYRLLKTLEQHNLLDPGLPEGQYSLGLGLLSLARRMIRDLREAAQPEVNRLAARHDATAFVGIREGDEIVCALSAEPDQQVLAIRHREGARLPLTGASSIAMKASHPPAPSDPAEVALARKHGYSVSEGQMFPGAFGIAAPITRPDAAADTAIALIYPIKPGEDEIFLASQDVIAAANRISAHFTI